MDERRGKANRLSTAAPGRSPYNSRSALARDSRTIALYAALITSFALAAIERGRSLVDATALLIEPEQVTGWPLTVARLSNRISGVPPGAEAAGVKKGDRLLAVAGRPYVGRSVLGTAVASARPGDRLAIEFERDGASGPLQASIPIPAHGRVSTIVLLNLGFFTPLLCLVLGFAVAALRPHDTRAWALLLLLVGFSQMADARELEPVRWGAWIRPFGVFYQDLARGSWAIGMLLFGILFPERLEIDRRRPWIKWLLIAPLIVDAFVRATLALFDSENFAAGARLASLHAALGPLPVIVQMSAIGSFFANLGYRTGVSTAPDLRRRLRLLQWGSNFGLVPIWIAVLYGMWSGRAFLGVPDTLLLTALLALPIFPITLAYVIVVERAMDVRVVVRQGLQYALAQRGVRVVQVLASLGVMALVVNLALEPGVRRPRRYQYIALGLLVVVIAQRLAERARGVIDRRFFREAVDAERVLSELGDEVRTIVETDPLLETVTRRLADALHAESATALLEDGPVFRVRRRAGTAGDPAATLPSDGRVAARLMQTKDALRVYLDDAQSWVNRELPADERESLEALRAQLLLPLSHRGKLLGVLTLGPKASEEPYSPSDVRLLRSVAAQTALALENSRLTAAVAAQVARAARLDREIEIAHEVQEQLFPQSYPRLAGLDLAGHCRPAAGVGGDYYDFLELTNGGLGIAVGDVSGKGIPAALLMAGLQASLRGQTLTGCADLALLMTNVNRLIVDASPSNRYATFFYGQYDPRDRGFRYVNAGHNAPMLFRGGNVIRLADGGPVVGLLFPAEYAEARATLLPGDLLVGFTDGISECMSPEDEEWGEERLIASIRGCDGMPARAVIEKIIKDADAFANGAKQHDDMTLVVVRLAPAP